jgi:hypothetical protein
MEMPTALLGKAVPAAPLLMSNSLAKCRDSQPPFSVHNKTAIPLEMGYFPPKEASDGSYAYNAPLASVVVSSTVCVVVDA